MNTAIVFPERGRDGVVRWFFVVPGAMDAGPYATEQEAITTAMLWAGNVEVRHNPEESK